MRKALIAKYLIVSLLIRHHIEEKQYQQQNVTKRFRNYNGVAADQLKKIIINLSLLSFQEIFSNLRN